MVASLDIAQYNLSHSHINLGMKMYAQLEEEPRWFTQYLWPLEDAAEEVRAVADIITGAVDEDGIPTPQTEDARRLRIDYARTVWLIESQLVD